MGPLGVESKVFYLRVSLIRFTDPGVSTILSLDSKLVLSFQTRDR